MGRSRNGNGIHGWLAIDKPPGPSSAAVVGQVRRLLDVRKAGHAGTLDPLASGVLPVAVGEATKTVRWMTDRRKTYRFTLRFGEARDTDDAAGRIASVSRSRPDDEAIRAALPAFTGSIVQTPPRYSALKIGGKRAYSLARSGQDVKLGPRTVSVDRFELTERLNEDLACFEVVCGKGTYIRSLARDLAAALGTCGHVHELRRTAVGSFVEEIAISLDKLSAVVHIAPPYDCLLPVTAALDDIPALTLTETQANCLRQGGAVRVNPETVPAADADKTGPLGEGTVLCALSRAAPVALARLVGDEIRPLRVFNL